MVNKNNYIINKNKIINEIKLLEKDVTKEINIINNLEHVNSEIKINTIDLLFKNILYNILNKHNCLKIIQVNRQRKLNYKNNILSNKNEKILINSLCEKLFLEESCLASLIMWPPISRSSSLC